VGDLEMKWPKKINRRKKVFAKEYTEALVKEQAMQSQGTMLRPGQANDALA
jgi:hypothetical protein